MALRIGAHRGYWPGDLSTKFAHRIGEREIFPEDESESINLDSQRMALEQQRTLFTGT